MGRRPGYVLVPDQRSHAERDALVAEHYNLIRSAIRELWHYCQARAFDRDLMISAGQMGLLKAASKFNATRGFTFPTYAHHCIVQWIKREANNRLVHVPCAYWDQSRERTEAMDPALREKARLASSTKSIFDINRNRDHAPGARRWNDWIPGRAEPPRLDLDQFQLAHAMRFLNIRNRLILRLRFWEQMSLDEVGEVLGVTKERIRQLEAKALAKVRRELLKAVPDIVERLDGLRAG